MRNGIKRRVGAISHLSERTKTLYIYGFGEYIGDEIPYEAVGFFADVAKQQKHKVPKIMLDNGKIIYGCECWWGDDVEVKKIVNELKEKGYKIVYVDIDRERDEFKRNCLRNKEE